MTIFLDDRPLGSTADLSGHALTALALIPDALEWVTWAAGNDTERYVFFDEVDLVRSTLPILHQTYVLSLGILGLTVSPLRLLDFAEEDLDIVLEAMMGDGDEKSIEQARTVVGENGLWVASDFDTARALLKNTTAAFHPATLESDLGSWIELAAVVAEIQGPDGLDKRGQQSAANFASTYAQTLSGFASYMSMYHHHAKRLGLSPAKSRRAAQQARLNLQASVLPHLRCPRFDAPPRAEALGADLRTWAASGHSLGFRSVARGISEIVANTTGDYLDAEAAVVAVNQIVATVQRIAIGDATASPKIRQDGLVLYDLDLSGSTLALLLDRDGTMTVDRLSIDLP